MVHHYTLSVVLRGGREGDVWNGIYRERQGEIGSLYVIQSRWYRVRGYS